MESEFSIDFDATGLTKEDDSDLDLLEEEQQRQLANLLENAFDDLVEYDDDDISADETGIMPNISYNESHNLDADDSRYESDRGLDNTQGHMEARCYESARSDARHYFGRPDKGAYLAGWPHHPALTNFGDGSVVPSTQLATGGSPDTSFEPSVLYSSGMGGGVSSATSLCSSRPNDSLLLPPILPPRNIHHVALGGQRYLSSGAPHLPVVETADACVEAIPENQREFDQLEILFKNRGRVIEQMRSSHEEHLKEARALRHRATLAEAELEASRKQYTDTLSRLTTAQHDVNSLRLNEQRFEQERVTLQQSLAAAEQRAANREADIHMLQEQLVSAQSLESLSKAKASQEHLVSALRCRADQESAALRAELDLARENIAKLTSDLASSRSLADAAQLERAVQLERQAAQLEAAQTKVTALLSSQNGQEIAQLRLELKQLAASKAITDDLNQVLQQESRDLKEQIDMLETAGKFRPSPEDAASLRLDFSTVDDTPEDGHCLTGLNAERTIAQLRQELTRCLDNYSAKRVQLTSLQEDMLGARRDTVEWQRRAERFECLLEEKREEFLSCELKLSKLMSSAAEPSAKEIQLDNEVARLGLLNDQLQVQLSDVRLRFEELVNSEERLSEQNEHLQRHLSQVLDQCDEEKRESMERVRQTCERHYDACRERMREELLHEAANERDRIVGQLNSQLEDAVLKLRQAQESYLQLADEKLCSERQAAAQLTAQIELTERRLAELRALSAAQVELALDDARKMWEQETLVKLTTQNDQAEHRLFELRAQSVVQVELAVDKARTVWEQETEHDLAELRAQAAVQMDEARKVWEQEAAIQLTAHNEITDRRLDELRALSATQMDEARKVWEQETAVQLNIKNLDAEERIAELCAQNAQLQERNSNDVASAVQKASSACQQLFEEERNTLVETSAQVKRENERLAKQIEKLDAVQAECITLHKERTQFEEQIGELRSALSAAQVKLDTQRVELMTSFSVREEQQARELTSAQQQVTELKKREAQLGARAAQLEALGVEVEVCVQERLRARQEKDVLRKAARDARADCERLQLELARNETFWEERLRETKSRLEAQFRGRFREYAARREQDYQERMLHHSSSASQTTSPQEAEKSSAYLHTLHKIRDDVMKHIAESQSRTAHTLRTEVMLQAQREACRQYALRLRNQLLSSRSDDSAALSQSSSSVLQLLERFVKQDSSSSECSDEVRRTELSRMLQSSTPERLSSSSTTFYHNRLTDLTNISLNDSTAVNAVVKSKQTSTIAQRDTAFNLCIS